MIEVFTPTKLIAFQVRVEGVSEISDSDAKFIDGPRLIVVGSGSRARSTFQLKRAVSHRLISLGACGILWPSQHKLANPSSIP